MTMEQSCTIFYGPGSNKPSTMQRLHYLIFGFYSYQRTFVCHLILFIS